MAESGLPSDAEPSTKAASANTTPVHAWEAFRSTAHFGCLDGLRFLSIVVVVWHHGPGVRMQGIGGRGYMGVPLFFAISGFLITTLLLREHEKKGTISLSRFYVRRSLRIFPLYFAVLTLYCILTRLLEPGTEATGRFYANLPYFLTYTSNWFVGTAGTFGFAWSLAAEEQFYCTWPSVLRYFKPHRAVAILAALLAAALAWNMFASPATHPRNFALVVLSNVPMAICWGCGVAFALHYRESFVFLWKILGNRWAPAVLLALSTVVLAILERNIIPVHFLFGLLVASCVIREDNILAPLLRQRWIVHTGMISYGMYLLHGLVYDALGKLLVWVPGWQAHSVVGFVVALAATIGVATLSFRYYEGPFLRLKSRFESATVSPAVALAQSAP